MGGSFRVFRISHALFTRVSFTGAAVWMGKAETTVFSEGSVRAS